MMMLPGFGMVGSKEERLRFLITIFLNVPLRALWIIGSSGLLVVQSTWCDVMMDPEEFGHDREIGLILFFMLGAVFGDDMDDDVRKAMETFGSELDEHDAEFLCQVQEAYDTLVKGFN